MTESLMGGGGGRRRRAAPHQHPRPRRRRMDTEQRTTAQTREGKVPNCLTYTGLHGIYLFFNL